jgi:transcriptional regulator with XRE-family HTH domain
MVEQRRRQRVLDGTIAECLRHAAAGTSFDVLAAALKVDAATVSEYLSGRCHIPSDHLLVLAKVLDLPVSYFYRGGAALDGETS